MLAAHLLHVKAPVVKQIPLVRFSKELIIAVSHLSQTFSGRARLIVAGGVKVEGVIMMAICQF